MFDLTALQDDFRLNALGDTERSTGIEVALEYFLTDPAGDFLTDPEGNFLIGRSYSTVYPQMLHSIQDDFRLNAE